MGLGLTGCLQTAPPELVQAIDDLDRQLVEAQGAVYAPEDYARFASQWASVKARMAAEADAIQWPWEPNTLVAELNRVQAQGEQALVTAAQRQSTEREEAAQRVAHVEQRLQLLASNLDSMGSRVVLGQQPVEADLLVKQARRLLDQGLYGRARQVSDRASASLDTQIRHLVAELGHYADETRVQNWRRMVRETVAWSRQHQASAIIVNKADRRLLLYRNGRLAQTYSVSLGYNGIREKRYQGDGATPEGQYRIVKKKNRGDTAFHRALLLDYPNAEDQRRFRLAQLAGTLPAHAFIGGQIEVHGQPHAAATETLGCMMVANQHMDTIFAAMKEGDPVTIVGAMELTNPVAITLAELEQTQEG